MNKTSALEAFEALEAMLRDELEDNGMEEVMKWAVCDSADDDVLDAAFRRSHVNLLRIRREKLELLEQLETGGRQRKRPVRRHEGDEGGRELVSREAVEKKREIMKRGGVLKELKVGRRGGSKVELLRQVAVERQVASGKGGGEKTPVAED